MAEQARPMPTGPGWWIGQRNAAAPRNTDNPEPHPIAVSWRRGKLCAGSSPVTDPCWTWFSEIPDPATCAAWVAAGRPGGGGIVTPAQQAASDALGLAVLATGRAKRALDALGNEAVAFIATEWCAAFDAWRDAHRAEARARAKLAALVDGEASDG